MPRRQVRGSDLGDEPIEDIAASDAAMAEAGDNVPWGWGQVKADLAWS